MTLEAVADVVRLLPSYVAYGALKRVVTLPTLARRAWRRPAGSDPDRARRAVAAVTRLSRHLSRREHDCLQRSLLLYRELSRVGANPVLMTGFRKAGPGVRGHAWVETGEARGRSVLAEDVSDYAVAMCFGAEGRLASTDATAQR